MKRVFGMIGLALAVTAFAAALPSFSTVARVGPYYQTPLAFDSATGGQVGGEVRTYLNCSTDTLLVTDVVYITTQNRVCKSATIANYNTIAGVVVGGAVTNMRAVTSLPDTGTLADTAAFPSQRVVVMNRGRTWVIADSAAIQAGLLIMPSTSKAGGVKAKTVALDSLDRILGRLTDSAFVKVPTLATINIR